ncbi:MAG: GDP-mannose 4,6-dehydratase [Candidatus Omnitrophica bacterium]|nr:GDP-mannose 4,6-dehydratase [Candidatus Omnitrophota bacterium]
MKALITGIAGFTASHLADVLLKQGLEVSGIDLAGSRLDNLLHIKNKIKLYSCDIGDAAGLAKVFKKVKPDFIFHLAAQSVPYESWARPVQSLSINILGTVNVLEAVRSLKLNSRVHLACSAEGYGLVKPGQIPVREEQLFLPLSPYAVGKAGQDLLGFQYFKSYGMFIVRTRAFNHIGPRMNQRFAASNFARQIALIEKGKQEPVILVGSLDPVRDFTDARDVAIAYWLSLKKGKAGEAYNVCSGKGYKMKALLGILLSFSKEKIKVKTDKARLRPSDVLMLVGDHTRISKTTGWRPRISFEQSLKDILNYWRERV